MILSKCSRIFRIEGVRELLGICQREGGQDRTTEQETRDIDKNVVMIDQILL